MAAQLPVASKQTLTAAPTLRLQPQPILTYGAAAASPAATPMNARAAVATPTAPERRGNFRKAPDSLMGTPAHSGASTPCGRGALLRNRLWPASGENTPVAGSVTPIRRQRSSGSFSTDNAEWRNFFGTAGARVRSASESSRLSLASIDNARFLDSLPGTPLATTPMATTPKNGEASKTLNAFGMSPVVEVDSPHIKRLMASPMLPPPSQLRSSAAAASAGSEAEGDAAEQLVAFLVDKAQEDEKASLLPWETPAGLGAPAWPLAAGFEPPEDALMGGA